MQLAEPHDPSAQQPASHASEDKQLNLELNDMQLAYDVFYFQRITGKDCKGLCTVHTVANAATQRNLHPRVHVNLLTYQDLLSEPLLYSKLE